MNTRRNRSTSTRALSPQLSTMHQSLMHHPEDETAKRMIEEQAQLEWTREYGADLTEAAVELADINEQHEHSCKVRRKLNKDQRNTKRRIPASQSQSDDGPAGPPDKWSGWDLATMALLAASAVACMGLGASNVYANLMASGTLIFIETPELAIALSALLPIGTVAVKQAVSFFDYDRTRKRYTMLIFGMTLSSLIAWSVLFALEFPGVSTSVDVEQLLTGSKRGSWMVWTQLATEMFAGSALFLAMERIAIKYKPNYLVDNPDYRESLQAIAAHAKTHALLSARSSHLEGEIIRLKADRQAFINAHVTALVERRSHLKQANNPQF